MVAEKARKMNIERSNRRRFERRREGTEGAEKDRRGIMMVISIKEER